MYKCQGCDFNNLVGYELLQFFSGEYIIQGIVKGLEVRINFFFKVIGEEVQVFICFNGWFCKDDFFDYLVFKCFYSQGYSSIGFVCVSGINSEDYIICFVCFNELFLVVGFGFDLLFVMAV